VPRGDFTLGNRQVANYYFAPPPQIFCLKKGPLWLGIGLGGVYDIEGVTLSLKGRISLTMKSRQSLANFEFPEILFLAGASEFELLESYGRFLRRSGRIPAGECRDGEEYAGGEYAGEKSGSRKAAGPATGPIYCTWGDQLLAGRERILLRAGLLGFSLLDRLPEGIAAQLLGTEPQFHRLNLNFSRPFYRRVNEAFVLRSVARIEELGLRIGTVILDDKWMRYHGMADADPAKFPDLRDLVRDLHDRGYRVFVWYPVWWVHPGSPVARDHPNYLVRDRYGRPKYLFDITHAGARAHIRDMIRAWLSPEGYDLDGLKLDFTYDAPSTENQFHDPAFGIGDRQAVRLHELIHGAAHEAKPRSVVVSISPNPFVNRWADMIRLNDYFPRHYRDQLMRVRIAHALCPATLLDADTYNHRNHYVRYIAYAAVFGVPDLYYVRFMRLPPSAWRTIREILAIYHEAGMPRGELVIEGERWRRVSGDEVLIETDGRTFRGAGREAIL
jgi:hypothetical protein